MGGSLRESGSHEGDREPGYRQHGSVIEPLIILQFVHYTLEAHVHVHVAHSQCPAIKGVK